MNNGNLKNLVKNISSYNKIIDKKTKINKISGHQKKEKIEKHNKNSISHSKKRKRSRSRNKSRSRSKEKVEEKLNKHHE
jgi:hypothetical protein